MMLCGWCQHAYFDVRLTRGAAQVMMAVNLVGYGFGQQAVMDTFQRLSESWPVGARLLISFFCATHLMFEIREREKRQLAVAID